MRKVERLQRTVNERVQQEHTAQETQMKQLMKVIAELEEKEKSVKQQQEVLEQTKRQVTEVKKQQKSIVSIDDITFLC